MADVATAMQGSQRGLEERLGVGFSFSSEFGDVSVNFDMQNIDIPLMSIAKQVTEAMNIITQINTMLRNCTQNVLSQLKKMEADDLKSCCNKGCCNKKKCCGGCKKVKCSVCETWLQQGKDKYTYTKNGLVICFDCYYDQESSTQSTASWAGRGMDLSGVSFAGSREG